MSVDNLAEPIVFGRSPESFAAAAQNAVDEWEKRRGGAPDELTTLRVVDIYVTAEHSFHDYIVALENRP
jgi:hypothetical protein